MIYTITNKKTGAKSTVEVTTTEQQIAQAVQGVLVPVLTKEDYDVTITLTKNS